MAKHMLWYTLMTYWCSLPQLRSIFSILAVRVVECIQAAGLKLKPTKCQFIREEVEYLGHQITPQGLKMNDRLVSAVKDFSRLRNLLEVKHFVGLCSYYCRFVPGFAQIMNPLHALTRKNTEFQWSIACKEAFQKLKDMLTTSPCVGISSISEPICLGDWCEHCWHWVSAFTTSGGWIAASSGLCQSFAHASWEELCHYRAGDTRRCLGYYPLIFIPYLYGHSVTVYTDYTAVKSVLEAPNKARKVVDQDLSIWYKGSLPACKTEFKCRFVSQGIFKHHLWRTVWGKGKCRLLWWMPPQTQALERLISY